MHDMHTGLAKLQRNDRESFLNRRYLYCHIYISNLRVRSFSKNPNGDFHFGFIGFLVAKTTCEMTLTASPRPHVLPY